MTQANQPADADADVDLKTTPGQSARAGRLPGRDNQRLPAQPSTRADAFTKLGPDPSSDRILRSGGMIDGGEKLPQYVRGVRGSRGSGA
jgi:hypothetical protein